MALRSSAECFNSIMNGEGLDEDTPSIDVEINVIQKEVEAEESASELNSEEQKVLKLLDNIDTACNIVDEAEMLINILKEDGINPLALKILSTNKIYTDVWKIGFPSTESLDVAGANRQQAEMIIAGLEEAKQKAEGGINKAIKYLMEKLQQFVDKFYDRTEKYAKQCDALIDRITKVKNSDWDLEGLEQAGKINTINPSEYNNIVNALASFNQSDISKIANKLLQKFSRGKLGSSESEYTDDAIKNLESVDMKIAPFSLKGIYDDLMKGVNGSVMYKAVKNAKEVHNKIKEKKDSISKAMSGESVDPSVKNRIMTFFANRYLKKAMNVTLTVQRSFISAASKVLKYSNKKEKSASDKDKDNS